MVHREFRGPVATTHWRVVDRSAEAERHRCLMTEEHLFIYLIRLGLCLGHQPSGNAGTDTVHNMTTTTT